MRWLTSLAVWAWTIAIGFLWGMLWAGADRWWPATLVMFGPRWVFAAPLVVLIPAALVLRRRLFWVLLIGVVMLFGPVMRFCLPWGRMTAQTDAALRLRVFSCNVHRNELAAESLAREIEAMNPDVVLLQDWTSRHHGIVFGKGQWQAQRDGELLIASRYPIRKVRNLLDPGLETGNATWYELNTPAGVVNVVNVHLASPHAALNGAVAHLPSAGRAIAENSARRRRETQIVTRCLAEIKGPVLIAGDLNTTTDSGIYREYWSSYTNAFSTSGLGFGNTYHTWWLGTRIDHILAGAGWQCRRCWVGPDVNSAHRPVIADMQWIKGAKTDSSSW